jgi:uncharacterized protein (DUF433 family)
MVLGHNSIVKSNGKTNIPRRSRPPVARVELGRHIVADPEICHGKPTYRGTRIMVWQILDELEHGMSHDDIVKAWGGSVSKAAIRETIALARGALLDARGRLMEVHNGRMAA